MKLIYHAAWVYNLTRFEIKFRGKVAQARNRFINTASNEYEKSAIVPQWAVNEHIKQLNNLLSIHYNEVSSFYGSMVRNRLYKKKSTTMFYSYMQEWISTEALKKSKMIASTDFDDVQKAISAGAEAGLGTSSIAKSIKDVTGLTTYRASTIARTETNSAATFGATETAREASKELGMVLLKKWLPTIDNRTRQSHKNMLNENAVPLNEKFNVDGEMLDRPCDPSGSAENVINCRCAIIFEEAP